MAQKRSLRRRVFTIEEANATLPLVRAIVADLAELSRDVLERRRRLSFLMDRREPEPGDLYHDELVQIQEDLDKDARRVEDYLEELHDLGVESVSGPEGMVDFPAMLDERRVCLSWRLGESEVHYWHEVGAGARQRQPLTSGSAAQPGDSQEGGNPLGV